MATSIPFQAPLVKIVQSFQSLTWQRLSRRIVIAITIVLPMPLLASAAKADSYQVQQSSFIQIQSNNQVQQSYSYRSNGGGKLVAQVPVITVQEALFYRGFDLSRDGKKGPETRQAIRNFQRSRNLIPTGEVDELTLQALGLSGFLDNVAPSSSTFGNCYSPSGDRSSRDALGGKRYVVVVPTDDVRTLEEIRRYCQGAYAVRSQLGSYVAVGSFTSRGQAEAWSEFLKKISSRDSYLKNLGFRDAHVRYF